LKGGKKKNSTNVIRSGGATSCQMTFLRNQMEERIKESWSSKSEIIRNWRQTGTVSGEAVLYEGGESFGVGWTGGGSGWILY